jgi:hypothetical protein
MNIGLGLGLQGTPDMHLGIVKSRQAAKDKYDAAQQKKKGDQISRFYQNFTKSLEGKRYLPVDERRISESSAAWYDFVESQVESGNPDMNAISEMTYKVQSEAAKANAQREMYDKVATNPKNSGVFGEDLRVLQSETDPNKLEEAAKSGSGSWQYNKQTGEVIWDLLPTYTPVEDQMQKFVKDNGQYIFIATEEPKEAFNIKGQSVRNIAINPAAKLMFVENATSGENLRSTLREYSADPMNRGKGRPDPTTEEGMTTLQNYAGQAFDNAANSLLKQQIFKESKGITNIFNAGEQKAIELVMTTPQKENIYEDADVKDGLGNKISFSVTSQGGAVLPEQEFVTSIPTNTFNTKTRQRVRSSRGTITGGIMGIYAVAKKNVKGKIPGTDREFEITAGEVIPNELLPIMVKAAGLTYKKMVKAEFVPTGEKGAIPVMFPATSEVEGKAFLGANKDKAALIDNSVKQLNDLLVGLQGLSEQQQYELINNYEGDLITNIEEIKQKYIDPTLGKGKKGGSGDKGGTGSGTPSYGNKIPSIDEWRVSQKKKGVTDPNKLNFKSYQEYKNTFKK